MTRVYYTAEGLKGLIKVCRCALGCWLSVFCFSLQGSLACSGWAAVTRWLCIGLLAPSTLIFSLVSDPEPKTCHICSAFDGTKLPSFPPHQRSLSCTPPSGCPCRSPRIPGTPSTMTSLMLSASCLQHSACLLPKGKPGLTATAHPIITSSGVDVVKRFNGLVAERLEWVMFAASMSRFPRSDCSSLQAL